MIKTILDTLSADNGRNYKIDYLTKVKDADLLRQVVFLALDPFTQFFIRKIPKYETATGRMDDRIDLASALTLLNKLSSRELTGHAGIEHLRSILSNCSANDAYVVECIIEKDLKCGIAASTANKVWDSLVHEYPCMLASSFEQKLVDKIKFPAFAQLKMDGMRFNAIVKGDKCEFRSRNGKLIDIPDATFQKPFIHMAHYMGRDTVFDGELLVVDSEGQPLDRKTGNGILNKAVKGTMMEADAANVRAILWDIIPVENFTAGRYDLSYIERVGGLNNTITDMKALTPYGGLVSMVEHRQVDTQAQATELFLEYLSKGQEGIILKDRFGIWEDKRSKSQIKYKGVFECDLKCIGWEEGTGKNAGRLGALQLESSCGMLKVGVGTGLDDNDRETIGRDVIGKIIAVEFNAIIDDKKKDTKSLFLPVFLEVRLDKATADALEDIKTFSPKML